jgi:hypothetical protein
MTVKEMEAARRKLGGLLFADNPAYGKNAPGPQRGGGRVGISYTMCRKILHSDLYGEEVRG